MTNEASVLLDSDAANKASTPSALQELGLRCRGQAMSPRQLTVWDEDPTTAQERLALVEKTIQGRDFTCMRETVNGLKPGSARLPGHVYANVRQPPISIPQTSPYNAFLGGMGRTERGRAS